MPHDIIDNRDQKLVDHVWRCGYCEHDFNLAPEWKEAMAQNCPTCGRMARLLVVMAPRDRRLVQGSAYQVANLGHGIDWLADSRLANRKYPNPFGV